ncbi:MAG TPA: hypothetical protein VHS59_02800 [Bacillota bacterium]|nr:hypothetical protein [Bacillota bacterium]
MLTNTVRMGFGAGEKPYSRITMEENDLVSKALYTGHAVFWENGISFVDSGYPQLNKIPGNQVRQEDVLVE